MEEESWTLPEYLVEKVISMLPFPAIFKARCLSKSWLARLSSVTSQQDDSKKHLARSFQRQVTQWSSNWRTFCPVYIDTMVFTAYDRLSQKWLTLPSLSYLPRDFLKLSAQQMEGPLLYGFIQEVMGVDMGKIYVVNILTGKWKQVPTLPSDDESSLFCLKLLIDQKSETYKVVLVLHQGIPPERPNPDNLSKIYVQIYDSATYAWINKTFLSSCDFVNYGVVTADIYLNGILYIAKTGNPLEFIAIDVKEGTLQEFRFPYIDTMQFESISLVVCNGGRLFMVAAEELYEEFHYVWKVDLSSRSVSYVARYEDREKIYFNPVSGGNRIMFLGLRSTLASADADEHYRAEAFSGGHVLEYNVDEDKFTFLSNVPPRIDQERYGWTQSSFQPGLSPFISV